MPPKSAKPSWGGTRGTPKIPARRPDLAKTRVKIGGGKKGITRVGTRTK